MVTFWYCWSVPPNSQSRSSGYHLPRSILNLLMSSPFQRRATPFSNLSPQELELNLTGAGRWIVGDGGKVSSSDYAGIGHYSTTGYINLTLMARNALSAQYTVPYPQVSTHPQVGTHICHESSQVVTVPGFKLRQVCRDGDMTMCVVPPSWHSIKKLLFYFAHCACCYNMYENAMDITAINTIKAVRSRHEKCYSVASYTGNM